MPPELVQRGEGSTACGVALTLSCAFGSTLAGFPQAWEKTLWVDGTRGSALGDLGKVTTLCRWQEKDQDLAERLPGSLGL